MRLLKKWIKNVGEGKLLDKHLEKLITGDAVRCNVYAESFDMKSFLENYYEAKKRHIVAALLGIMPNRAQYQHINKEGEEASHPEKYLLGIRFNDTLTGTDMNTYDGRVRKSEDMFIVWWGDEKDLEYLVEAVNRDYNNEVERTKEYYKICKKLMDDSALTTLRRGKKTAEKKA